MALLRMALPDCHPDGTADGWQSDMDMMADGIAEDGTTSYSITLDLAAANIKFRAGDSWDLNLGGDLAALSAGGDNIAISEAGNYTVVLSFDGETYSTTVTKN